MSDLIGPVVQVDTSALFAASAQCLDARTSLAQAASTLGEVRDGASSWALDAGLPDALARFMASLAWALDSAQAEAGALADHLAAAGRDYASAESTADQAARTLDPDGRAPMRARD